MSGGQQKLGRKSDVTNQKLQNFNLQRSLGLNTFKDAAKKLNSSIERPNLVTKTKILSLTKKLVTNRSVNNLHRPIKQQNTSH